MKVAVVGAGSIASTGQLAPVPPPSPGPERMARRLMSRGALLAHIAIREAIADAGWEDVSDVGVFMAVGASGGSIEAIEAMVEPSLIDGELSWEAFGSAGLRAASPLLAFQLMNNFSMCHAAILAGTRGPSQVLFSRGPQTIGAFEEAIAAIAEGECARALVGAADTALDPVTRAEIERAGGELDKGGEGAAMFALSSDRGGALATIRPGDAGDALVVQCDAVRDAVGDCLAATPALAALLALDYIAAGHPLVSLVSDGGALTFEAVA